MTKIKLTALPIIIFLSITVLSSCDRDDIEQQSTFSKAGIVLSGAKEVPANPSTATGTMDVSYSKLSKTLSYKVSWSGLTDSLSLMHIHGLAPTGFTASPVQNIVATSSTIFLQKTGTRFTYTKSGTISGTLFVDGTAIKEADLLNGLFYMNIHTNGANPNGGTYSGGEIRGQIEFQ
jgi:hypothetical protein